MSPVLVIPAKAGIQMFVNYRNMDTGFRQYDALWVFLNKFPVLSAFWTRRCLVPTIRICFYLCYDYINKIYELIRLEIQYILGE